MLPILMNPQKLAFLMKLGKTKYVLFKQLDRGAFINHLLAELADVLLYVLNVVHLFACEKYLSL